MYMYERGQVTGFSHWVSIQCTVYVVLFENADRFNFLDSQFLVSI
jgi:hypothetical protein